MLTNSSQTLWVTRANHTNDGRYQCHAENDLGNVSRNFIVKITGNQKLITLIKKEMINRRLHNFDF